VKTFVTSLFLTKRFFGIGWGVTALFIAAYFLPELLPVAVGAISLLFAATVLDVIRLFRVKAGISASRHTLAKWSNGDENPVTVEVRNRYPFPWTCGCWTSCPCSCKNAAWTCNVASLRGRRKRSPTWCGRSRAGCMRMAPSTC
jgi:hypothetical protein